MEICFFDHVHLWILGEVVVRLVHSINQLFKLRPDAHCMPFELAVVQTIVTL